MTVQEPAKAIKYRTPLRQALRDLTRSRIKDAARLLFYEKHYDSTTMDDIAIAAGLRRSTLYLHYKDKAEILAEVIADYTPKAQAVLATLPGPTPSLDKISRWIRKVASFVAQERVPLSIILEMRRDRANFDALEDLTSALIAALGTTNAAFRDASNSDADPVQRARALLLFQELTFTCERIVEDPDNDRSRALVTVTSEHFHQFLR